MTHGTYTGYTSGCRCEPCARASLIYHRAYYRHTQRKINKVPSEAACNHILWLGEYGIGADTIADCCGVGHCTVRRIRQGKRPLIHQRTEQRILSVTREGVADGTLVDASFAQSLLRELLAEGWTQADLRRALYGSGTSLWILRAKRIWARTQHRVERLHARAMRDGQLAIPTRRVA